MRQVKLMFSALWWALLCVMTGCAGNPSATTDSGAVMELSVDRSSVGTNGGQVLATATVSKADGTKVAGLPVTFAVSTGPATVDPNLATVTTVSDGKAMTILSPGVAASPANVIVTATTSLGGQPVSASATFQVLPAQSGLTLSFDRTTVAANSGQVLATATVNSTSGTPVPASAVTFSITSGPATIPQALAAVNTDSAGKAITTILPGDTPTSAVVIVAATTSIDGKDVSAYASLQVQQASSGMTLTLAHPTIGSNVGQMLVTAIVTSADGSTIPNVPVTFSIGSGPATVAAGFTTVNTDSSGKAITSVTPGDAPGTANVIVSATATVNGKTVSANASFQIVRGTDGISFITTGTSPNAPFGTVNAPIDPTAGTAGNLVVPSTSANQAFELFQMLPFKVTDANGNPRVGVPVTLSVDNQLTGFATIVINNPTVTTDSTGHGTFNVGVIMVAPAPGTTHADSIIYKAVSTETAPVPPLLTYGSFVTTITTSPVVVPGGNPPPQPPPPGTNVGALALTPNSANFGAANNLTLVVSGGVAPFTVTSSAPNRVSVALQPDGVTVIASLIDKGPTAVIATVTVVDALGNQALAVLSR